MLFALFEMFFNWLMKIAECYDPVYGTAMLMYYLEVFALSGVWLLFLPVTWPLLFLALFYG